MRKIIIGVVLLLAGILAFHQSGPRSVVDGHSITIDSGSHHIEGTLEPETTHRFIMKDEGSSIGTFSGDAFVTMLPPEKADQLRAQYGDFFKCNAPGARQAMHGLLGVVLVADGKETRDAISEAMALVRSSRIPVVSFSGSRIQVTKQTSLKMNVADHTGTVLYHVKDFKILKPNYLQ